MCLFRRQVALEKLLEQVQNVVEGLRARTKDEDHGKVTEHGNGGRGLHGVDRPPSQ